MTKEKKNLQRKSRIRRPSERRPVDLRKKDRPFGKLIWNPSPETSPPVSELESPKLKMIGGFLHQQWTEYGKEARTIQMRRKTPILILLKVKKKKREAMWENTEMDGIVVVGSFRLLSLMAVWTLHLTTDFSSASAENDGLLCSCCRPLLSSSSLFPPLNWGWP